MISHISTTTKTNTTKHGSFCDIIPINDSTTVDIEYDHNSDEHNVPYDNDDIVSYQSDYNSKLTSNDDNI